MPRTNAAGSKPAPKRQPVEKPETKPKQEPAPAATEPTPSPAPTDDAMFDDVQPAPPEAVPPPVAPDASSEAPVAPESTAQGDAQDDDAKGQTAPENPAPVTQSPADVHDGPVPPADEPLAPQEPVGADTSDGPVQAAEQAPSGSPVRVRLGHAEGVLHRVPLGVVQELVAESGSRIATLQISPTISDLQNRMRVSEGRCAPIFFTMEEGDDRPRLFAGVESVAAALNLGLDTVSVVTINAGDAGAAQQHLASKANGRAASSQDDVLEIIE